jgi:hypothetical protein
VNIGDSLVINLTENKIEKVIPIKEVYLWTTGFF